MEETLAPTASKWENPLFRINFVKQSMCFAHCLECLLQKHIRKSEKCARDWKNIYFWVKKRTYNNKVSQCTHNTGFKCLQRPEPV